MGRYRRIGQILGIVTLVISVVTLSGCGTPQTYAESESHTLAVKNNIHEANQHQKDASPPVVVKDDYYIDHEKVSLKRAPTWLNNRITIRGDNLPFQFYASKILKGTPEFVHYDHSVNKNENVSMNYSGSVKGAMNSLAAKSGYAYEVEDDRVNWSDFMTKTFNIAFMPGSAKYLIGREKGEQDMMGTSGSSGGGGGGGGGTDQTTYVGGDINGKQFSNLQGDLSVWKDISSTIKGMLSPDGNMTVAESTTSVTVYDHPQNIRQIEKYVTHLNEELSRQVLLQVKVLEIQLNKQFNYGVDWNLVEGNLVIAGNNASPVNFTPLGNTTATAAGYGLVSTSRLSNAATFGLSAPYTNPAEAVVQAIAQQGTLNVVTEPSVVTLNNQLATISITTQTGYLASSAVTFGSSSSADTGSDLGQNELTPGEAITGFTMYILPKIKEGKVYLQITSNLSDLTSIQNISSGQQFIQVPNIDSKQFNVRSVVPSRDTLVIAGFKETGDQTGTSNFFFTDLLGGKGATQSNTEVIILITPIILKNYT